MKELTTSDLHDYANHFNALISWIRLGRSIDEYQLRMPKEYFENKYPERYMHISYPESFQHTRLQTVISYFNSQVKRTTTLLKRLLTIVGEIIYGNPNQFVYAL
jgi:hypothetical protein